MNSADFQLQGVGDPRLAVHAASALPAWLWSLDGAQILWANPVGAGVFGAANASALASRNFGLADPHRRQVAQLADRLPPTGAMRLERLRGFGAALGGLVTCACARLDFSDGGSGILITAAEPAGRSMPLVERLQRLVDGIDTPIAAFARDGLLVGASDAARSLFGFRDLTEAGLDAARDDALRDGRAETPIGPGHMVLQRVGSGSDLGLVALLVPGATHHSAALHTPPSPEPQSEPLGETPPAAEQPVNPAPPAEFAEFAGLTLDNNPSREPSPHMRRHPLRFTWQMDAEGRFSFGSDEFTRLIGTRTAAGFGRLWSEITEQFGLDPDDRVAKAVATRNTWSGITLLWPVDGPDAHLPVELSGLPIYDRARNFAGYRGFGVCRDHEGLARLAARRRDEFLFSETSPPLPADASNSPDTAPVPPESLQQPAEPDSTVETPKNVLPFRSSTDLKSPSLTPVENNAFNELARQLSARLESEPITAEPETAAEQPVAPETSDTTGSQADLLSQPEPPPQDNSARDRQVFDLLPTGVMIYRLDRLLYANKAFLAQAGYDSLHALEEAGGADALRVESGVSADSTSATGTPVTISVGPPSGAPQQQPIAANLFVIAWDGEPAHALICANAPADAELAAAAPPASTPSPVGHATAEELGAILDTAAEGVVMFDEGGRITACNRSAEALFGHSGDSLTQLNLADLFAPESQPAVRDYLNGLTRADVASPLDQGRDVLGRARAGGLIPLSMTMGRTQADGPNFFSVFRDLSPARKIETELLQARRQADRAANAKADVLARISHEVRMPLNAIIGFAEVMIGEKFGALGNERYVEYMKDIRTSGERVIAFIDDLLDLSQIETGKLDLAFVNQNLNELVEQCVSVMQPQANRERIIIRTSLAHTLPAVVADVRALRQITLNLIGNSIHLANAGGQVIVSTALNDFGDVALRVRDTGQGLNENEVAAATEPFRTPAPSDQSSESAGVSLSLTKALVEANRAQFHIKTGPHSGTLIEVVFSQVTTRA
ncbi:MAG: PAS domain-containing protein [Nitrobacter sp.]